MPNNKDKEKFTKEFIPYFNSEYDSKGRFCSYWHQINEICSLNPKNLLEIGVGNSFVSKYLSDKNIKIITLDALPSLKPLISGSVLSLPFKKNSFELVSCCEVLEHLPYFEFTHALEEISRVSKNNMIISLPDVTPLYRVNIELPRIKPIKKLIPHPFPRLKNYKYNGEHYWEIGWKDYKLNKIISDINRVGLKVIETYRVFEQYYHRFFRLKIQEI